MVKPLALLTFDTDSEDAFFFKKRLENIEGVDGWLMCFGNSFIIRKSIDGSVLADEIDGSLGLSFVIVEFDSGKDISGYVPKRVGEELKAIEGDLVSAE